jgi:hypothetical protein
MRAKDTLVMLAWYDDMVSLINTFDKARRYLLGFVHRKEIVFLALYLLEFVCRLNLYALITIRADIGNLGYMALHISRVRRIAVGITNAHPDITPMYLQLLGHILPRLLFWYRQSQLLANKAKQGLLSRMGSQEAKDNARRNQEYIYRQ